MDQNITKNNLFAVVVWYNPTVEHVAALTGYMKSVKRVIVIDNSSYNNQLLLQNYGDKIYYSSNRQNLGIATALNIGFKKAIELGAEWVLTMDQDSRFKDNNFTKYITLCNNYKQIHSVGIFSPHQVYGDEPSQDLPTYEQRIEVMTSGNIVRTEAFQQVNGFRDDFFIDLVDEEFCLRLKHAGYNIIMINQARLEHCLGNGFVYNRLFHRKFIDHPPLRYYYIFRNTWVMEQLYPEQKSHYQHKLRKLFKRLCLYASTKKIEKLCMIWYAYKDFRHQYMGQFEKIRKQNN